jgi:phosphatidylinositol alpha-mannosyltransferase
MKIGLVCPYHIFRGGGVQECVFALQRELVARGHEAKIITPLPRDTNGHSSDDDSIVFVGTSANVKSPFHTTAQVSVALDQRSMSEMLEREQFDVLHFHEPWVPIMSRQLLTQSDTVNVATFHAKLPETVMSKTIEKVITPYTKSVLKYLDSFTAVSNAAAQYVKTITDEPITIVPNGIDLTRYTNVPAKNVGRNPHLLYVGRLEKRKGVKYLLLAFALFSEKFPRAQLHIAGDGPDREKLEQLVAEEKIMNVTFHGFVSDKQKQKLFNATDLFCSPALYGESFGIVLLEAMAKGIVTVAGDNPGYADVMQGRGALSLVNPEDTSQFAKRLELLLTDEETRALWREWALDYVQQFDYPNVVDQYVQVYKQALKHKQYVRKI